MSLNIENVIRLKNAQGYKNLLQQLTKSADFEEHRRYSRMSAELRVSYWLETDKKIECIGITKDMSIGGCLLVSTRTIPIDTKVKIELSLDDENSTKIVTSGKIVRLHNSGTNLMEYGVSFDGLTSKDYKSFEKYCFNKMYKSVGLNDWPTKTV